jgi:hypothetical protein
VQGEELLLTFAEVAVGLAGFTGLAGVLSGGPESRQRSMQTSLLASMLETSLMAAAFSLLPLLLLQGEWREAIVWRAASGLYLVAFGAAFAHGVRRSYRITRALGRLPTSPVWVEVMALGLGVIGLLALAALGWPLRSAAFAYAGALFLQLVLSGLFFYQFFLMLRVRGDP